MPPNENFITRNINAGIASAGGAAGSLIDGGGKSIQTSGRGLGQTVTNKANSSGGVVRDYANGIRDAAGSGGSRSTTTSNPLGLSGNKASGKSQISGGSSSTRGSGGTSATKGTASNPLGL